MDAHQEISPLPLVTIIIPVYNVEKYLRECLDSVIRQTLHEIQIICVNDGSPDHSQQILEEYTAKDARIMIIQKENGGLSSARNAAYPHIQGKYTLFVDSDDRIDPTLCEKTYTAAEKEDADITFFSFSRLPHSFWDYTTLNRLKNMQKVSSFNETALVNLPRTACVKLWKTEFILKNQIFFPEGILFEDMLTHWKAILRSPKLAFFPEPLYYYRTNQASITQTEKVYHSHLPVFNCIKDILIKENCYSGEWKKNFLRMKLKVLFKRSLTLPSKFKNQHLQEIKDSLGQDELDFIKQSHSLHWPMKAFYDSINGSAIGTMKYSIYVCCLRFSIYTGCFRFLRTLKNWYARVLLRKAI